MFRVFRHVLQANFDYLFFYFLICKFYIFGKYSKNNISFSPKIYTMNKKVLLLTPLLCISLSLQAQKDKASSGNSLQKIIVNESPVNSDTYSTLEIISNPKEVEKLKKMIQKNNSKKIASEAKNLKNLSLANKYRNGDKSVVPQLIQILKGNDLKAKSDIYDNLSRRYDDPQDYSISEPELRKAILNNIILPEDEKDVIQLAGFMAFPEMREVFEKRLLSGESADIQRLVFWLGRDGKSLKALPYVADKIRNKEIDLVGNSYIINGIMDFYKNTSDEETKKLALDLCIELYYSTLDDNSISDEIYPNPKSINNELVYFLLETDDPRVAEIAKNSLRKGYEQKNAIIFLIKQEGPKHEPFAIKMLNSNRYVFDAIQPLAEVYKLNKKEKLLHLILKRFEKEDSFDPYYTEEMAEMLIEINAEHCFNDLGKYIKNPKLVAALQKAYQLEKSNVDVMAKDAYEMGVVDQPVSADVIQKVKEEMVENKNADYKYSFIENAGISMGFDSEASTIPVEYDKLILDFAKLANGDIKDLEVWMDTKTNKNYEITYNILISANHKIYKISPEDMGDWYDVGTILNTMNKILEDTGTSKKFVSVDSGDQYVQIFYGPEENVNNFADKYNLIYTYEYGAE